jgi:ATP sulfurylase
MTTAKPKKSRKTLSIEEKKAKLAKQKELHAAKEAKLAILELKDYISNLKIASVGSVFSIVKANKPGVSSLNVLQTLAEIGGLKVVITEKQKVPRKLKNNSDNQ